MMKEKMKKYNSSDLLLHVPQDTVITTQYLRNVGVSDRMMYHYVHNLNLFEPIGRGAFERKGDSVDWRSAVYALQLHNDNVHVGGLTSLNLLKTTHYVRFNCPTHLFFSEQFKLPKWCNYFKKHKIELFNGSFLNSKEGIVDYHTGSFIIKISCPERAILEYLYLCPNKVSLKEAYQMMEGAMSFRPKLLQSLLESSTSIKTNRLFLFMAEKLNHKWFKYIDTSKIKLGTSKWTIVRGGKFDSKYKITVPKNIENI